MRKLCARCKKRLAVVFITKLEDGNKVNEGLCLKCAKELGIQPVNDLLENMGIGEDELEQMSSEMEGIIGMLPDNVDSDGDGEDDGGSAPAIDLPKMFRDFGLTRGEGENGDVEGNKRESSQKDKKSKEKKRKYLDSYCHNLTKSAQEGKLDRIVGREKELARVIQILGRRQKNNPCLIGEPGVGKTAIAEALAQKIVDGDVSYKLRNCEVYLVDLTALVAGTQFRGQFETRILGLINEVKEAGNIILVIDEIHNIIGTGNSEGSMNAANILKPALSRGEIQVIGATTLEEYRKYIERDAALERRFQPVNVAEPSIEDTVKILLGIKSYYELYHGVKIPEALVRVAVRLSERYITDRYLPDKAIDLIDEASSQVALSSSVINERFKIGESVADLAKEKAEIEALPDSTESDRQEKYRMLADIRVREIHLSERVRELDEACACVEVTADDLANVIEIWTGIPASSISENEFRKMDSLAQRLKERIVGQDVAIDAVVRATKRKRVGVSYRKTPVSFIFAGPTGVGKTELVRVLAEELFDMPEALIRLDMSEFMEKHSVSRIIGSPPGYVGYDEAGQLTEKIRRRPYSVVLFDEIEKAHPDVLNILLQVLDDGKITDAHGKQVSFENTIIVMTTNAGSDKSTAISGFFENSVQYDKEKTEKALLTFLRPEFINRIDEIITFRHLDIADFKAIAAIMLGQLAEALSEKNIKLYYSDDVLEFVAEKSFSEKYGARNMRRFISVNIEDKIVEKIIENYDAPISGVSLTISNEEITLSAI